MSNTSEVFRSPEELCNLFYDLIKPEKYSFVYERDVKKLLDSDSKYYSVQIVILKEQIDPKSIKDTPENTIILVPRPASVGYDDGGITSYDVYNSNFLEVEKPKWVDINQKPFPGLDGLRRSKIFEQL
jgi:hypothetical protein